MLTDSKPVEIALHELPRDIRLWLCKRIGWKEAQHFGIVRLFAQSGVMGELREKLNERKIDPHQLKG